MVSIVKKGKDRYSQREWVQAHRNVYNGGDYCKTAVNGALDATAGHKMIKRSIKKKLRKVKLGCLLDESKTTVRLSRSESGRIKGELSDIVDDYLKVTSNINNLISKNLKG